MGLTADSLPFFTSILFQDQKNLCFFDALIQKVESYFYLGGKKALLITKQGEGRSKREVELVEREISIIELALKIASYCTLIFPIVMLAMKCCFRASHTFYIKPQKIQLFYTDISQIEFQKIHKVFKPPSL